MDGKVVELVSKPKQDQQSVVDVLEGMLEDARNGEFVAIAVAAVRPTMAVDTAWSSSDYGAALLGAVSIMSQRLIRRIEE